MSDPVLRPLQWSKEFHVYAEQNGMFDVFMELFRELVMWKPADPLVYIRDELPRISRSIYSPRVFILGEYPGTVTKIYASWSLQMTNLKTGLMYDRWFVLAIEIGQNIAENSGALFLTLEEIVRTAPEDIRGNIEPSLFGKSDPDMCTSNILVAVINRRVCMSDCMNCGYVIHGFPRSKTEAMVAQQNGLIPRQVFILLPEGLETFGLATGAGSKDPNDKNSVKKMASKLSVSQLQEKKDFFNMKDIGAAYSQDICRVIPYDRWVTTKQSDLEAEFLGQIIARKPSGAPWIPKIVVLGPPGAGKSIITDHLAEKFMLIKLDWLEMVRGCSRWNDTTAAECKAYLQDMNPLSEDAVRIILDRKLNRDDCAKKGYILEGFPETVIEAKIMEDMSLTPNRIFLVSITEAESQRRMAAKRDIINARRLPGFSGISIRASSTARTSESGEIRAMATNPHSEQAVKRRFLTFTDNFDDLMTFFGSRMVYIDGGQPIDVVKEFTEASVIRPPTLQF